MGYGGINVPGLDKFDFIDATALEALQSTNFLPVIEGDSLYKAPADLFGGQKTVTYVVGTSTAGHTLMDCDYLCDGTDDQVEIQAALDAIPEGGGSVLLLQGEYHTTDPINIQHSNIQILGQGAGSIINFEKATNVYAFRILNGLDQIRLSNFSITSTGESKQFAIYASQILHCFFDNLNIYNIYKGILVTVTQNILNFAIVQSCCIEVEDCAIQGNSGVLATNNYIKTKGSSGVHSVGQLIQNYIYSIGTWAVYMSQEYANIVISNNFIHGNRGGILVSSRAAGGCISGNYIEVNGGMDDACIKINQIGGHAGYLNIQGNACFCANAIGIMLTTARYCLILGNLLSGSLSKNNENITWGTNGYPLQLKGTENTKNCIRDNLYIGKDAKIDGGSGNTNVNNIVVT